MLKEEKFQELSAKDNELVEYYQRQGNGFYKVNVLDDSDRDILKDKFKKLGFSALNFTDSRSVYQFYNLENLWRDIQIALSAGIKVWHPATEPVSAGEVYFYLSGNTFVNELEGKPAYYDYKTIHSELFGGQNGYICDKRKVLEEIKRFVEA